MPEHKAQNLISQDITRKLQTNVKPTSDFLHTHSLIFHLADLKHNCGAVTARFVSLRSNRIDQFCKPLKWICRNRPNVIIAFRRARCISTEEEMPPSYDLAASVSRSYNMCEIEGEGATSAERTRTPTTAECVCVCARVMTFFPLEYHIWLK